MAEKRAQHSILEVFDLKAEHAKRSLSLIQ